MALTDLPGLIPTSVTCAFPKTVDGVWSGENYVKTTTLASLALAEFTGALANANTHVLHPSAVAAYVGMAGTPSNQTELDAMAVQMATDWYRWQLGKANVAFNGTVPFVPSGLVDAIEWNWDQPRPRTAVYRAPFNDMASKRLTSTGAGASIVNAYFSLYVVNAFITNLYVTKIANFSNVYVTFLNVTYDVNNTFFFSYYGDTVYIGHFVTNVCPANVTDKKSGDSSTINGDWTDLANSSKDVVSAGNTKKAILTGSVYCTGDYSDVFELRFMVNGVAEGSVATFAPSGSAVSLEVPMRPAIVDLVSGNNPVKIQARRVSGSGSMSVTTSDWVIYAAGIKVEHPGPVCVVDPNTCCTTEGPRDPPPEPPTQITCGETTYGFSRRLRAAFSNPSGPCAGTLPAFIDLDFVSNDGTTIVWLTTDCVTLGDGCGRRFQVSVSCFDGALVWLFSDATANDVIYDPALAVGWDTGFVDLSGYTAGDCDTPPLCCQSTFADIVVSEL